MWPFRRNRGTGEAPAPEPAAAAAVHRAGPAAWRSAPPLAVVQTSRTTIDPGFVSRLATRADPSFLAPLGHHVVPEAPAGAVHGLAVPDAGPRGVRPAARQRSRRRRQRVVAGATATADAGAPPRRTPATPDATVVAARATPAPVAGRSSRRSARSSTPRPWPSRRSRRAPPSSCGRWTTRPRRPEAGPLPVDADPPAAIAGDPPHAGADAVDGADDRRRRGDAGADAGADPDGSPDACGRRPSCRASRRTLRRRPAARGHASGHRSNAPRRPAPTPRSAAPSALQRQVERPAGRSEPVRSASADAAPEPGAAGLVGTTPLAPAHRLAGPAGDDARQRRRRAAGPSVQTAADRVDPCDPRHARGDVDARADDRRHLDRRRAAVRRSPRRRHRAVAGWRAVAPRGRRHGRRSDRRAGPAPRRRADRHADARRRDARRGRRSTPRPLVGAAHGPRRSVTRSAAA